MRASVTSRFDSIDPAGEFPFATAEYLFYLIFQIDRQRDIAFEALIGPLDLDLASWRCLSIIRRIDGCTMKALATYSTIDRTTLTRSVDYLVGRGLVERTTPPTDRRKVNLTLTEAGEAMYGRAVSVLAAPNNQILAPLSDAARREIARSLQGVLKSAVTDPVQAEALLTFGRSTADA